jgi:hypothetical protein
MSNSIKGFLAMLMKVTATSIVRVNRVSRAKTLLTRTLVRVAMILRQRMVKMKTMKTKAKKVWVDRKRERKRK